jgi:hypothetical protein
MVKHIRSLRSQLSRVGFALNSNGPFLEAELFCEGELTCDTCLG